LKHDHQIDPSKRRYFFDGLFSPTVTEMPPFFPTIRGRSGLNRPKSAIGGDLLQPDSG